MEVATCAQEVLQSDPIQYPLPTLIYPPCASNANAHDEDIVHPTITLVPTLLKRLFPLSVQAHTLDQLLIHDPLIQNHEAALTCHP